MIETLLRRTVLAVALVGLAIGLYAMWSPEPPDWLPASGLLFSIGTIPVLVLLVISILRDVLIGRFGVDAIALVSMSAALILDQPLAAIVVAIMYAGGTVLEDFARGRAERDLRLLADRSPRTAHRLRADSYVTIAVGEVAVGDRLLVRAGELVPVDGALIDPVARLDESAVTGEPLPATRRGGDPLRSGTVNAGEPFTMEALATADASTYAGIVRMVAAAQTARAPFMRMADRYALVLLPVTLLVGGLAWFLSGDPVRGLAVLVVATPCPLILAAPVAFIGGVSRAARMGVLMKGSGALEALASVRTAVFDKTGTLTLGGAELLGADVAPGRDEDEVLRLLASLEQATHHVIAESIVRASRARGLVLSLPTEVREYRGAGLEGLVDGVAVRTGSRGLIVGTDELPQWAQTAISDATDKTVLRVLVELDGQLAAVFTFGDTLRGDAAAALAAMRSNGIGRIVMLTGDDGAAAAQIGALLPLDQIISDATPAGKVDAIRTEVRRGPTLMVGDGINDAPAMAAATVGVAMAARGATASSEAADIVVLADRLMPLADALVVARRTRGIALQSVLAGLGLSGVAMVAAAFGYITPVMGALIQEGIDVAVILNALRALTGSRRPRD